MRIVISISKDSKMYLLQSHLTEDETRRTNRVVELQRIMQHDCVLLKQIVSKDNDIL